MNYSISHTLFIGKDTIFLPMCHSTNAIASGLLKENKITEGAVVITDQQTSGKGQRGARWESQPMKNLTFSIVLRPVFLEPIHIFYLTIFTSLGLTDVLENFSEDFKIKWPNDIFYKNRKVCGILIENSIKRKSINTTIIGIGLNVNQQEFQTPGAASLWEITGRELNKNEILNELVRAIEKRYMQLKEDARDELKRGYLERLFWIGEKHTFFDQDFFEGKITGVSPAGRLIIARESGSREYDFKEVRFVK